MQTQDAQTEILFKFWPWFEANKQRLIYAGAAIVALFIVWLYFSSQRQQNAIAAGEAYTAFQLSQSPASTVKQVTDGYLAIATKYSGTVSAQRAQLQAGTALFNAGSYADAQKVFENFAATEARSSLVIYAKLGVAASLEAQGKLEEALGAYRAAANLASGSAESVMAKFAQARILESQGKPAEATNLYQDIARSPIAGTMASEAAQRLAQLQAKSAPAASAPKP